jgi:hypothetical protein
MLHGAARRQSHGELRHRVGEGGRQRRHHPGGGSIPPNGTASPEPLPPPAPCNAASAPRESLCGPKRSSIRKDPTSIARRSKVASAHICAAAPGTSRSSTPSNSSPRRAPIPGPGPRRRHRKTGCEVRGSGAVAGRSGLHRRHGRARNAARRTPAHRSHPCRRPRHRHLPRRSRRGCRRRVYGRRHSRRSAKVGLIHKDWPVMIPVGGVRATRATCWRSSLPKTS